MKCADANTRLSLVTAILNSLRAVMPASFEEHGEQARAGEIGSGAGVLRVALVAQLAVERRDRLAPRRRAHAAAATTARARSVTCAAAAGPARRAMWVSGAAASKARYVSTMASGHARPSARARRRAGTPSSNVVWKSVAYSRATASRSRASAMASRRLTVGGAVTS